MHATAIDIHQLSHSYAKRAALSELSLTVNRGEVLVFLGPNGGGKTTLFRILTTLVPPQTGRVSVFGKDIVTETIDVRRSIGVVFQAPSLDRKLTVAENLWQQASLYGLASPVTRERSRELLAQLGLSDRASEMVETLSGGLRRRVELAKGMIHRPALLLMDEPSTGLDPGARSDLWRYLFQLRDQTGVTVVLTSHLLEEADRADRVAILHQGRLVALDSPAALRASIGGDSLTITASQPDLLARDITDRFGMSAEVVDGQVRLEQSDGHQWIARLVEAFPDRIESVKLGKPTLEDVFIDKTGHRFWKMAGEEVPVG